MLLDRVFCIIRGLIDTIKVVVFAVAVIKKWCYWHRNFLEQEIDDYINTKEIWDVASLRGKIYYYGYDIYFELMNLTIRLIRCEHVVVSPLIMVKNNQNIIIRTKVGSWSQKLSGTTIHIWTNLFTATLLMNTISFSNLNHTLNRHISRSTGQVESMPFCLLPVKWIPSWIISTSSVINIKCLNIHYSVGT